MLQQIGNITRKQGLNKARNKPKSGAEDLKSPDKASPQKLSKMSWDDEKPPGDMAQYVNENIDFSAYQHLDFINFDSVEVDALPLMVDCRPAAGPAPHDIAHSAPNGAPPEAHQNQAAANNEMGAHGITSPASVRASTPATSNALTPYTGGNPPGGVGGPGPVYSNVGFAGGVGTVGVNGMGGMAPAGVGPGPAPVFGGVGGVNCAPYMCGKLLWCAAQSPPPHAPHPPPPPPPHGVNPHVFKSVQANGADLPMNDIPTLRYYFNLGVECMWAAYGPPPPHHPPRHYSPRDLAQDMQQMAIHDGRALPHAGGEQNHKHAPRDNKPPLAQGKGAQRPLLGPRFKRGGNNQDNNQTNNHNQNKGHNNNMGNKGPNNRRNSHMESRGYGAGAGAGDEGCAEPALLPLPYIPYPPPIYPIPYYPIDSDPAMMGMMGGMGYVGYEEGVEYAAPIQYYPPHYPPPPHHPPPHHPQHPQHPQHPSHHQDNK